MGEWNTENVALLPLTPQPLAPDYRGEGGCFLAATKLYLRTGEKDGLDAEYGVKAVARILAADWNFQSKAAVVSSFSQMGVTVVGIRVNPSSARERTR